MATLEDAKSDARRIIAKGVVDDPKRFKRLLGFLKYQSRHDLEASELLSKLEPFQYVTDKAKSPKPIEARYPEPKSNYSQPKTGIIGKLLKALIPSLITGLLFYFLVGLTRGMDKIGSTPGLWYLVGVIIFEVLFVFTSDGKLILGRFFKYVAYEFWITPIITIIYTISSVGQANADVGVGGGIGAGIGGALLIGLAVIIGAFGGLIMYLIGNSINKRSIKASF